MLECCRQFAEFVALSAFARFANRELGFGFPDTPLIILRLRNFPRCLSAEGFDFRDPLGASASILRNPTLPSDEEMRNKLCGENS